MGDIDTQVSTKSNILFFLLGKLLISVGLDENPN